MAKVEMTYLNSSGTYETIYPKVDLSNITGTLPVANGGTGTTSLDSLMTSMGATRIQTGSYVGTGTYGESNPCSLTFNFEPIMILFLNASHLEDENFPLFLTPNMTKSKLYNDAYQQSPSRYYWCLDSVTWSNNNKKVSWYSKGAPSWEVGPEWQMNISNQVYNYKVFY